MSAKWGKRRVVCAREMRGVEMGNRENKKVETQKRKRGRREREKERVEEKKE